MPDIGATIRELTLADVTVEGLIGSRMYSDALPDFRVYPAVTYRVISTIPNEHLTGIADVATARVEVTSWTDTSRTESVALADAVRIALEKKHRGDNSGQFINEIELISGEQYTHTFQVGTSKVQSFETTLDFYVHYRTTTS